MIASQVLQQGHKVSQNMFLDSRWRRILPVWAGGCKWIPMSPNPARKDPRLLS